MDSRLPIARRTRLREALIFKELYERRQREKEKKEEEGDDEDSVQSRSGIGVGRSYGDGGGRNGSIESVAVCVGGEEEVVDMAEPEIGREWVDSVDSVAWKSLGLRNVVESKIDIENVDAIDVDDGRDDEVELIAEGWYVDSVHSNCSILKAGSGVGSKVACDMRKNAVCIDVDEVVSSGKRVAEDAGLKGSGKRKSNADESPVGLGSVKGSSKDASEALSIDLDELESSSEEDNDDSEDENYGEDKSCNSVSGDSSSYSFHDEDDDQDDYDDKDTSIVKRGAACWKGDNGRSADDEAVKKGGEVHREGKRKRAGAPLNRRYVPDQRSLVNSDNKIGSYEDNHVKVDQGQSCVAWRTRSHFESGLRKKKMKLGTVSRPLCIDDELSDSIISSDNDCSSNVDHNDVDENENYNVDYADKSYCCQKTRKKSGHNGRYTQKDHQKTRRDCGNNVDCAQKVCGKDEGELGKPAKRKRVRAPKNYDVLKILVDSIWDKGEMFQEEVASSRNEAPNEERNHDDKSLQLKFTFGVEESNPPEKSDYDKEVDQLWSEFDFVIRSGEIGFSDSSMVGADTCSPDSKTIPDTLCHQGNHQLILDDQIGIICKYCSLVQLEIKYIVPSFCKHHWGKSEKREFGNTGESIFNELQFQTSDYDTNFGRDSTVHAKSTVWDIIPGIRSSMYPHQREGFEFIWKNVAGEIHLNKLKEPRSFDGGSGCIISHAPGTGKTRLTIVFLQTYMELFPRCRPVIIAPRSILLTWEQEFKKWKVDIPFHNLNKPDLSGNENVAAVNFLRQIRNHDGCVLSKRLVKLFSWKEDKSILGVSYRLYEKLASGGAENEDGKNKDRHNPEAEQVRKILLELPGLLVLDEGHTPRNDQSLIWKALSKIETERRIILSGTPFQNNFGELYNTLCLVRPKFADWFSSAHCGDQSKAGRKNSLARGKWTSLTNSIGKVADDKLEELRALIDPFVHVHKGTILQESLPGLRDSVVVLQPAKYQKSLLEGILGVRNKLELGYLVSLISVHPSLLPKGFYGLFESFVDEDRLENLRLNPDAGVKTKFLMELIRLCEALNEKVLVFSQYIDPLTFIRNQLKSHYNWTEGKEVLYMDGQLDVNKRQVSISVFNEPMSEVRVLLASTKACSEGINLVGASRVVLLDVVWNPSVERQAISRAYRLGQKKIVYIYHLITSGTMEAEKYCRQAEKDRLSEMVFSSSDRDSFKQKVSSTVSEDKILEEMVQHDKLKYMFEKIITQPKESNLIETFGLVDS